VTATIRQTDLWIAVTAAALLHAAAFVVLVVLALMEMVFESRRRAGPPAVVGESVVVELSPSLFERVQEIGRQQPAAEDPPEPKERSFMKTAPEQEVAEKTERGRFIGERDTVAASERRPPDPGIRRMPAQDGVEPRFEGHVSTFDSEFTPGDEPARRTSVSREREALAGAPRESASGREEAVAPPDGKSNREKEPATEEGRPREMILQSDNHVPVPGKEGRGPEGDGERRPKEAGDDPEALATRSGEGGTGRQRVEDQPPEPGFRTESRKTRVLGSFTRQGKSSLDVDNTLVGRYQARVSRALESEWQKKCIVYRDHIEPGMLTIRFFVDKRGRVSGLRYIDVLRASEIQKGFTVNAIRDAPIPAMPGEVAKELDDEPLELVINFLF